MPRRTLAVVVAALALGSSLVGAAWGQGAPASFLFAGSGFGHGVGMSQYGAYGQALEGATFSQILQHYYTGISVGSATDDVQIRVNLLHTVPSAQVRGEPLPSTSGGAIQVVADATTLNAAPNEVIAFGVSGSQVTVTQGGSQVATANLVSVLWSGGPTLLNVIGPGDSFDTGGHRYRYGMVDIAVVNGNLEVVNQLKLHGEYLWGIAEVPSSWPAEALKAQVVAARTYALRRYQSGQRPECRCHVYDTTADQVFAGYVKQSSTGGAQWTAAVDATSPDGSTGITALYGGAPISANYFSSSGGRTENNEDAFGGSPVPYLRSVDDHWSLNSYNPMASWTFTRTQAQVASAFGLPDVVTIDLSSRTVGGAVKTVTAKSSGGGSASLSGGTFVARLSLPARWLHKPVVRVAGADRYATSVAIGQQALSPTVGGTANSPVVLASGEGPHLVDGLVAAPLARADNAELLLATAAGLPSSVAAEIDRTHPTTAYLVGGTAALGPGVEQDLRAHGVTDVKRLAGADRYDTAAQVAEQIGGPRDQVLIASGASLHLVDALAAGGPASATTKPILLVARDEVPTPTAHALTDLRTHSTVVVGGTAAVSDATMAQLPSPRRLAGGDRFLTAIAVSNDFSGLVGVATVVVASGADAHLVDALPGGTLAHIVLLTDPTPLTPATRDWLKARVDLGAVQVLGGTTAVSSSAFDAIRAAVGG